AAQSYELNRFEQQVLQSNPTDVDVNSDTSHADVPLMRDADADDLRDNMGFEGWVVKNVVGSGTRREPNGVGQYRHVMDRDHERFLQPGRELDYQLDRAADAVSEKTQEVIDGVREKASDIKEGAQRAVGDAIDNAVDAGKEAVTDAIQDGIKRVM